MLLLVAIVLMLIGAVLLPSDKYTSYTGAGTVVVAILLFIAGIVAMFVYFGREDDKCSTKGGTYLAREGKCIDVKEIP